MSQGHPIQRLRFGHGLRWLPAAAEVLSRQPSAFAGIAGIWLLISMLAVLFPVIGQLMLVIFTPLITAGLLIANDRVGQGLRPHPLTLFAAWKEPVTRLRLVLIGLFSLGGALAAAMVLVTWISAQLNPEALESLQALSDAEPEVQLEALVDALAGTSPGLGLVMAGLVFGLVLAAMYFAIPLIAFGRWSLWPSLAYSVKAAVINWRAMIGFFLAAIALLGGLFLIVMVLVSVFTLALGTFGAMLAQVLMLILAMAVQLLMAGAQYQAFCEIFGWSPGPEEPPPGPDSAVDL